MFPRAESRTKTEMFPERRGRPWLAELTVRLVRRKPLGAFGASLVLVALVAAVFADLIAPYGFNEAHPAERLQHPSPEYLLGTDSLGRDSLSRIIYGARISMTIGFGAAALVTLLSTLIGLVSGYFGGGVDALLQRFVDALVCFPVLIVALILMAILGPGISNVILSLGFLLGLRNAMVIRGTVLSIKENQYVEAARAVGCGHLRIALLHILPNVMAPIIIVATVNLGYIILVEASLSFLGFGVPPPNPSWGGMLSGQGLHFMYMAPELAVWPGIALSLVVFGFNVFGDALRDLLDPRLRGTL